MQKVIDFLFFLLVNYLHNYHFFSLSFFGFIKQTNFFDYAKWCAVIVVNKYKILFMGEEDCVLYVCQSDKVNELCIGSISLIDV